ncbi:hypothetical protein BLOT_008882 [Blomia tropicalis]|nr:hypothetical protein BLOT_008882 [Blomia tropicalis]
MDTTDHRVSSCCCGGGGGDSPDCAIAVAIVNCYALFLVYGHRTAIKRMEWNEMKRNGTDRCCVCFDRRYRYALQPTTTTTAAAAANQFK